MKISKNRIVGGVWAIVAIAYLVMAFQIPETTMEGDPGPAIFPYIAGFLMLCSSIAMMIRKPTEKEQKVWLTKEQLVRLWSLFAVMVAYVFGLSWIGYTLPTMMILIAMCYMFAKVSNANVPLWQCVVYGVVLSVVIYLLFTNLLSVPLPAGKIKALNFLAKLR